MFLLRKPILALSKSERLRHLLTALPVTSKVVSRFVAGETTADAVRVVAELRRTGRLATVDHLGEFTTDPAHATANVNAYLELIAALQTADVARDTELSIKLTAVGADLASSPAVTDGGEAFALEGARRIAHAAYSAGARLTIDMEDHRTTDTTLRILKALRDDFPDVGIALQAMLYRTETDLANMVAEGVRVRLVKGAYDEPADVALQQPAAVNRAYVRGLKTLLAGSGYVMIGSHDPRLIDIGDQLAARYHRSPTTFEHQLLYGIRPDEQLRLVAAGKTVRVYVPYGKDWFGYFMRRLAERPANLLFFLRSLVTKS